ncbi:MAG: class I tRNA ligase family protein [Anaerolineales bacterium]|nr:class I tRNA ligase family protein [Anaerolineales bacterium]
MGKKKGSKKKIAERPHIERYDPGEIEHRWQSRWEADELYKAVIDPKKEKFYFLTMLPYTSGDMHIGHWYAMTPSDARARYLRMRGFNVMYPIGFDAFGLPAENAAIDHGIHPKEWTYKNIENQRRQLRSMGAMWDWSREAISSDPEYYRWSEWFFLQMYKNDLAYKKMSPVDWCPQCNTTLAREQVWGEDRHCERCKTPVIKKNLDQWFFRITRYAQELLDFAILDWPDPVKTLQENWIGRSEGANVTFPTEDGDPIEVFTTRPDTLWGATFMVLAPEHPLVEKLTSTEQTEVVHEYVHQAARQSDIEREAIDKEKTGVFTGGYAINPVNDERIPVWIADYVLMTYGTGAIMAVPAHDERDFEFALKFGLPILPVIERPDGLTKSMALAGTMKKGFAQALDKEKIPFEEREGSLLINIPLDKVSRYIEIAQEYVKPDSWVEVVGTNWSFIFHDEIWEWNSYASDVRILERCQSLEPNVRDKRTVMELLWGVEFYRDALYHDGYGTMINSGPMTGTPGEEAFEQTNAFLEQKGVGQYAVNYRLHDWLISRQRYWGAPIPIVYCQECGIVPVPEEQLPVVLPDDVEWRPTGESPLKFHPTWKHTQCPVCDEPAERETDTMDTFMCSSWYHLRYLSPTYDKSPFDPKEYDYWMPVDTYTGGVEHATMHLIYTRFFHKAFRDLGVTEGHEPMLQLRNQGQILGPDGQRMSKSRGNVIDPDEQVATYGADAVRAYLMFGYRWSEGGPWNPDNIQGVVRWLHRVWSLVLETKDAQAVEEDAERARTLLRKVHQTIRQVSHDFENFEFNTVISALMELTNTIADARDTQQAGTPAFEQAIETLLLLMAPPTPHISEELWMRLGKPYSIHNQPWPEYDPELAKEDEITLVVQVNGRVRDRITVPADIREEDAKAIALGSETVQRFTGGAEPRKVIFVKGRLVNIVI